jgi:hypothetical protein
VKTLWAPTASYRDSFTFLNHVCWWDAKEMPLSQGDSSVVGSLPDWARSLRFQ